MVVVNKKKNSHIFFASSREKALRLCENKKSQKTGEEFKNSQSKARELDLREKRLEKLNNIIAHTKIKKQLTKQGQREEIVPNHNGQPALYKWKQVRRR